MNCKLSTKRTAEYLGTTESTLRKWRLTGYGPRYFKLAANRVVYDPVDLDSWLADRAYNNTTEEAEKAA
jgi:predicted DNA-binding transcriptional regulator AlpA